MKDITVRRLAGQGFNSMSLDSPDAVVYWLGALQAQDYAGVKWSIGLRLAGSTIADVESAIAARTIVRTWALRGTLHFVAAEDINWLLGLIAPRIIAKNARRYRQLALDESTLARSSELLVRALDGGRELDRQALRAFLEAEGLSTEGQRIFYMLQRASLDGLICQGAAPKNKPTFLTLAPSSKHDRSMDREEALAKLAVRYFTSHGPATVDDFIWWSGLLAADAKAGLQAARPRLVRETTAGKTFWLAETVPAAAGSAPDIYLLPGFDEYFVGYRDRSAVIDEQYVEAWSKGKAMFSPSIVRRGQVIGLWKRAVKKDRIEITADLFSDLSQDDSDALQKGAQAYGRFLGKRAILLHA